MFDKRIVAALILQAIALSLFLMEFLGTILNVDAFQVSWQVHELIELAAILGLSLGFVITLVTLRKSLSRTARVEEQLRVASGSFHAMLQDKFDEWGLTPAERETALLVIKGFSIAEIAQIRAKSEGTIKAQNSAIYSKSGQAGRTQLVSYFIEELAAGD